MAQLENRGYLRENLAAYYDPLTELSPAKRVYRHRQSGRTLICCSLPRGADTTVYQRLAGYKNDHLAQVYDILFEEDHPVIVREFVPGVTLAQLMREQPPNVGQVRRIATDVCDGLIALHSLKIVHKDIKPENIVITVGGASKIIDYGIATVFDDGRPVKTTTLGTVGFAAPEQFGFSRTDARTDIYAFGVMLNLLLTHEHPTARQYRGGRWGRVLKKCLATNPDDRYESAVALRKELG